MKIGPDTQVRFTGGRALIVAGVAPDGTPVATRGWGAIVVDGGAALRVYLDADDALALELLVPDAAIAVTGADVTTMVSAQAKGRIRAVDELTALDVATRERETELFVQQVHATDGSPRKLIESMVPARFVALTFDVEELYDQTPGPRAGASLPEDAA